VCVLLSGHSFILPLFLYHLNPIVFCKTLFPPSDTNVHTIFAHLLRGKEKERKEKKRKRKKRKGKKRKGKKRKKRNEKKEKKSKEKKRNKRKEMKKRKEKKTKENKRKVKTKEKNKEIYTYLFDTAISSGVRLPSLAVIDAPYFINSRTKSQAASEFF
jgi:flagellar biosynthesis component FlhA